MKKKKYIPRKYSPEFKAEAVRLAEETDRTGQEIAEELGIPVSTLNIWLHRKRKRAKEAPTKDEKSEIAALRRENERLRMERDFLKKAAAFFAKDGS